MRAQFLLFLAVQALPGIVQDQIPNWIEAGDRALSAGLPEKAATEYRQALDAMIRAHGPAAAVLQLRLAVVTADLEAGHIRDAESLLLQVAETPPPRDDGLARAAVLNAQAAVHMYHGRWNETERALGDARAILAQLSEPGDLLPSVLHNLAVVQMKTGHYKDALAAENDARSQWEHSPVPHPSSLVKSYAAIGILHYFLGNPDEAHAWLGRAIASARSTFGNEHPIMADLLETDAVILNRLKLKKRAKLAQAEARRICGGRCGAAGAGRMIWNLREALPPDAAVSVQIK